MYLYFVSTVESSFFVIWIIEISKNFSIQFLSMTICKLWYTLNICTHIYCLQSSFFPRVYACAVNLLRLGNKSWIKIKASLMQFVSFDLLVLHNTPLIDKKTTQKNKFLYSLFFQKIIFIAHKLIICDKLIDHKQKSLQEFFSS